MDRDNTFLPAFAKRQSQQETYLSTLLQMSQQLQRAAETLRALHTDVDHVRESLLTNVSKLVVEDKNGTTATTVVPKTDAQRHSATDKHNFDGLQGPKPEDGEAASTNFDAETRHYRINSDRSSYKRTTLHNKNLRTHKYAVPRGKPHPNYQPNTYPTRRRESTTEMDAEDSNRPVRVSSDSADLKTTSKVKPGSFREPQKRV